MSQPVFRIDKFIVPADVRAFFIGRIAKTHTILRKCEGYIRDGVYEQYDGPGRYNIVTFVEWAGEETIEAASEAVRAAWLKDGFNPQNFMQENGIVPDMGMYRCIHP